MKDKTSQERGCVLIICDICNVVYNYPAVPFNHIGLFCVLFAVSLFHDTKFRFVTQEKFYAGGGAWARHCLHCFFGFNVGRGKLDFFCSM